MLKNRGKNINFFAKKEQKMADEPSRFVVDLKKQFVEAEKKANIFFKKEKSEFNFVKKIEKIKNTGLKEKITGLKEKKEAIKKELVKPIKIEKEKIKKNIAKLIKNPPQIDYASRPFKPSIWQNIILLFHITDKARNGYLMYGAKFKKLFIFKFFYSIYWIIVFSARFIYLLILRIVDYPISAIKNVISPPKNLFEIAKDEFYDKNKFDKRYFAPVFEHFLHKNEHKKLFSSLCVIENKLVSEIQLILKKEKKKFSFPFLNNLKFERFFIQPKPHLLKSAAIFAVILIILIAPFKIFIYFDFGDLKAKVLESSMAALNNLKEGGIEAGRFDFGGASKNFSDAANNFLAAQKEFASVNDFLLRLASLAPDENIRLASQGKEILLAGEIASRMGANLTLIADNLFNENGQGRDFNVIFDNIINYGEKAKIDAAELTKVFKEIDIDNLPEEYKNKFSLIREKSILLENGLEEIISIAKQAKMFLGVAENKRYLLVFQNNAEMRGPGGFIGSYALVDFKNGKIKNIEVPAGGSYDTEAGLYDMVAAPEPLQLINPLWHFWDANWWPDWPTSAKKLMWFYEHSGGPTVDGVISLTPTVIERLLEITGPIDLTEKYGVIVDSDNFWEATKNVINENNKLDIANLKKATTTPANQENRPKKIIGDLTMKILEELPKKLNKDNIIKLLGIMDSNLSEKHILLYFTDNELQSGAEKYGWDGKIKQTQWDYLSVINTNIGGGKTDRKIRETITHQAEVKSDGTIIDSVEIKREHTGGKFEPFWGIRNVDWMRIYVPLGSRLIEADGFEKPDEIYFEKPDEIWTKDADVLKEENSKKKDELSGTKIYEEAGKTVFANWSMADPGQTIIIRLKYELPFKIILSESYKWSEKILDMFNSNDNNSVPYALLAQKQSGSIGSIFKSELILPENMKIKWHYPDEIKAGLDGWNIEDILSTDKYWAGVIQVN